MYISCSIHGRVDEVHMAEDQGLMQAAAHAVMLHMPCKASQIRARHRDIPGCY